MERAAFGKQFGPGGTMDRTVDAAAAEQRRIRGVDDGVNASVVMSATMTSSRALPIWRAVKLRPRPPR